MGKKGKASSNESIYSGGGGGGGGLKGNFHITTVEQLHVGMD